MNNNSIRGIPFFKALTQSNRAPLPNTLPPPVPFNLFGQQRYAPFSKNETPLFSYAFLQTKVAQLDTQNVNMNIVNKISPFVGYINCSGKIKGGCLLISPNKILVPYHCIEEELLKYYSNDQQIKILVLLPELSDQSLVIKNILNFSRRRDFAILELMTSFSISNIPKLTKDDSNIKQLLLFHFPDRENLHVSGHGNILGQFDIKGLLITDHDSINSSSGGIYVNSNGEIVAMNLGKDPYCLGIDKTTIAISMKAIFDKDAFLDMDLTQGLTPHGAAGQTIYFNKLRCCCINVTFDNNIHNNIPVVIQNAFENNFNGNEFLNLTVLNINTERGNFDISLIICRETKYLAGVELKQNNTLILKLSPFFIGYTQVDERYPEDVKRINTHPFYDEEIIQQILNATQSQQNKQIPQRFFDYFIQVLEIAKLPVIRMFNEHLVNKFQEYQITNFDALVKLEPNCETIPFIMHSVKTNYGKLVSIATSLKQLELKDLINKVYNIFRNGENNEIEFIKNFIVSILYKAINVISANGKIDFTRVTKMENTLSEIYSCNNIDEIIIILTKFRGIIVDLFYPKVI